MIDANLAILFRSQMLPKFDNNEKFPAKLVGSWTTQYGELDQVGEILVE